MMIDDDDDEIQMLPRNMLLYNLDKTLNKHTLLVIKKRVYSRPKLLSSTKILLWVQVFRKFSDFFLILWNTWCQQPKAKHTLCKGKFFSSDLKHPCFVLFYFVLQWE